MYLFILIILCFSVIVIHTYINTALMCMLDFTVDV